MRKRRGRGLEATRGDPPASADAWRGDETSGDTVAELTVRFELFPVDLDAFYDFYVRVLRFEVERDERESAAPYLSVRRGTVHIGAVPAWASTDPSFRLPPQGVEIVFEVDDVNAERNTIIDAGVELFEDVVDRPWRMRDFRLLDPDGTFIRFTSTT